MFYDNYIRLCNSVNKSPSACAEEMGLKRSVVTAWKNGRVPREATKARVAAYFGVSPAYLDADYDVYGLSGEEWKHIGRILKTSFGSLWSVYEIAQKTKTSEEAITNLFENGTPVSPRTIQAICDTLNRKAEDVLGKTYSSKLFMKKAPSEDGAEFDDFTYAAHNYSGRLTDADKEVIKKMMATLAAANEEDNGQTDGGLQRSE